MPVEYHKPYKRFNKIVKVPRGQAPFTLNENIHYDYKVSGRRWCDRRVGPVGERYCRCIQYWAL